VDTRTTSDGATTGRTGDPEPEATLARALAAAQVGIWSYDHTEREHWDRTTKALFGWPPEREPTTELFLACVHPDDRRPFAQAFAAAIDPSGSGHYECDFRIKRPDTREERWLSSRGEAEFSGGRFVRLIGVVLDVTAQKRGEQTARDSEERVRRILANVRDSEQRFRGIFEHAATGIALVGLDGEFQQCNPAFAKMLGYTEAEMRGVNMRALVHPEDLPELLEKNEKLLAGEVSSFEIVNRYLRKDGSVRWSRRFVSLLHDADGRPESVMVLATDMTERIAYEQKIGLLLREVNHRA
jgi:PAS domain S-box-containing protein